MAVTGMGIISSVGNDIETYWKNLVAGVCGIDYIQNFDVESLPVKIAGKIKDFHPEDYGMDKPFIRKQDLFCPYGMAAAWQAMKDSGLVFIPTMISNIAAGHISIKHHAQGPCLDIVTACATSSHCIGEAFRAIRHGYADAIIAGGCENATIPLGIAGFANAKALSRAEDPNYASLPFNGNRQGFVMGDGAGMLVLEEMEHAKARGATIYGEVVGYGNTCDAWHPTAPRPDGTTQAKCLNIALEEAGFNMDEDNLYINAHGTGTRLNDVAETVMYKTALGDYAYKAHISSIKSMTGHMFGAARPSPRCWPCATG